jgi:hypothetical protein
VWGIRRAVRTAVVVGVVVVAGAITGHVLSGRALLTRGCLARLRLVAPGMAALAHHKHVIVRVVYVLAGWALCGCCGLIIGATAGSGVFRARCAA